MARIYKLLIACIAISLVVFYAITIIKPEEIKASSGGAITLSQTSDVTVTLLPDGPDYTKYNNIFGLWTPTRRELGYAKNIPHYTQFNLGQFTGGAELIFFITNPNNQTFFTGPGSRNPDGVVHANVTVTGSNQWQIGFEDLWTGGDRDYNDVVLRVTATPACTAQAAKKCAGDDLYWYDSCDNKQEIFQDCGDDTLTNNYRCSGNTAQREKLDKGCLSNACFSNSVWENQQNCSDIGKVCQSGQCVNITCSSNSNCGTNSYIGDSFCRSGDVYKTYRTYTCSNPGTANSSCSSSTDDRLITDCAANQTCSNGSCQDVNIACSANSACGANGYIGNPFCQGNVVYQNYKTYTCNNPGTANSSCSNSTESQLKQTCAANQTCSNGSCQNVNIACSSNSNCGTNSYIGDSFCRSGDVYKTYRTYTCSNPGTANSSCSSSTDDRLITDCAANQTCSNGSCQNQQDNVSVQTNSATNTSNSQATLNGYLYGVAASSSTYAWFQWGNSASYGYETSRQTQNYTGSFSQNIAGLSSGIVYHFRAVAQGGNNQIVYGQDMTFTTSGPTGNLTINKTARNMTAGNLSWSNAVYANPSDVLMFMITIQATGNQGASNVFVRDIFPANLIYKNQLVVSGSINYSGDITSGINLGAISAGQTVTITYQAQIASAQNFSYGTTTLNNNVNVTGSGSNNPTGNATIVVTRSAIYGATTIDTGLTDNFLVDSFLLPLMIALTGIWMFKLGVFFRVEKWVDSRKSTRRDYKTQKELRTKITQIKQREGTV